MKKELYLCKQCSCQDVQNFYTHNHSTCKTCISIKNKEKNAALRPQKAKVEKVKVEIEVQTPTPVKKQGLTREEKAKMGRYYKTDDVINTRWTQARYRAGKKGLEFDITKEDLYQLVSIQNYRCSYSNIQFDNNDDRYTVSVDRIDSSRGYTKDNITLVCSCVNYMKKEYSEDDFLSYVENIYLNTIGKKKKSGS